MDKFDMRDWVASLEDVIDNKLQKWLKANKIENGASVHLGWQFEQTHFLLYVFWHDGMESATLNFICPYGDHAYRYVGLGDETFNRIMDRVGNLAQITMHPPRG